MGKSAKGESCAPMDCKLCRSACNLEAVLYNGDSEGGMKMKVRLAVSEERQEELTEALLRGGFELDDDAELVLLENDRWLRHIPVRDGDGNRLLLATEDILFIESFGHSVVVHAADGIYHTADQQLRHHPAPSGQKDPSVTVHEIRFSDGRRLQGGRDQDLLQQLQGLFWNLRRIIPWP